MWNTSAEPLRGHEGHSANQRRPAFSIPQRQQQQQQQQQQRRQHRMTGVTASFTGQQLPLFTLLLLVIIMPFVLLSYPSSDSTQHPAMRFVNAPSAPAPSIREIYESRQKNPTFDHDGICSSFDSCHKTRVFIAIQSRSDRREQRRLVRRTWLKWATRYNSESNMTAGGQVPIAWRFFLHGSAAKMNETSHDSSIQSELAAEKDLVLASLKLHNQPPPRSTAYSSYVSPYGSSSYSTKINISSSYSIPTYSQRLRGFNYSAYGQRQRLRSFNHTTYGQRLRRSNYSYTFHDHRNMRDVPSRRKLSSLSNSRPSFTTPPKDETYTSYTPVECTAAEMSAWKLKTNIYSRNRASNDMPPCSVGRWAPEAQQIAWALNAFVDYAYFLHVSDDGLLCVDWLMQELEHRPSERFLWGKFNCHADRETSAPSMDSSFVLMSRDVAEWWLKLQGMEVDASVPIPANVHSGTASQGGAGGNFVGLDEEGFGGANYRPGTSTHAARSSTWKLEPPKESIPLDILANLLGTPLVLDDQQRLIGPRTASAFLEDYRNEVKQAKAAKNTLFAGNHVWPQRSSTRASSAFLNNYWAAEKQVRAAEKQELPAESPLQSHRRLLDTSRLSGSRRTYSRYGRYNSSRSNRTSDQFPRYSSRSYSTPRQEKPLGPVFCHRFIWASDLTQSIILLEKEPQRESSPSSKGNIPFSTRSILPTERTTTTSSGYTSSSHSVQQKKTELPEIANKNIGFAKSSTSSTTAAASSTNSHSHTTFLDRLFGIAPQVVQGSVVTSNFTPVGDRSMDDGVMYEYGVLEAERRRLLQVDEEDDDPIISDAATHPDRAHPNLSSPDDSLTSANNAVDSLLTNKAGERTRDPRIWRNINTESQRKSATTDTLLPNFTILETLYGTMTDPNIDWKAPTRNYAILGPLCSAPPRRPNASRTQELYMERYQKFNQQDQIGPHASPRTLEPWETPPLYVFMQMLGHLFDMQTNYLSRNEMALEAERLQHLNSWSSMLRGSTPRIANLEREVAAKTEEHKYLQSRLFDCSLKVSCMWEVAKEFSVVLEAWRDVDARRSLRCCGPKSRAFLGVCGPYKDRTFVPPSRRGSVRRTVLASFPGSGNTWARLLLEYGSGYLTGSTYDDVDLMSLMPAEGRDEPSCVVAVKTHTNPSTFMPRVMPQRVIFLVRHPLKAIWAEFQRRRLHDHAGAIDVNLTQLASSSYGSYTNTRLLRIDFPKFSSCMACRWLQFVAVHSQLSSHRDAKVRVIRYEDLQVDTAGVLQGLLRFVFKVDGTSDETVSPEERIPPLDPARLQCAVQLANRDSIHRTKKVTAEDLFREHSHVACDSWEVLSMSPASRILLSTLGYENFADIGGDVCSSRKGRSAFSSKYYMISHPCSIKFDGPQQQKTC